MWEQEKEEKEVVEKQVDVEEEKREEDEVERR